MVMIVLLFGWAFAASAHLIMQRHQLEVGQSMVVELRVSGIDLASAPILPAGPGLNTEFKGTTNSTKISIVNGRQQVIQEQAFRYLISGVKEGEWYIGPLQLGVKGRSAAIKPERIFVFPKSEEEQKNASVEADLIRGTDQSKALDKIYEGELLSYHFTYQRRLRNISTDWRPPSLKGLTLLDGLDPKQENYSIYDDGATVNIDEIWLPIKAEQAGIYRIAPAKIVATIPDGRQRNRGIFSFFSNSGTQRSYLTEEMRGLVLTLPEAPDDFSGLVGDFELRQQPDRRKIRLGEAVTLQLEMKGRGDLRSYRFPSLEVQNVRTYDEKASRSLSWIKNRGERSVYMPQASLRQERSIVPLKEGTLEIAPLNVVVFDPDQERYVQLHTEPIQITVLPGEGGDLDIELFSQETESQDISISTAPAQPKGRFLPVWIWAVPPLFPLFALGNKWRKTKRAQKAKEPELDDLSDPKERAASFMRKIRKESTERYGWTDFQLELLKERDSERAEFYIALEKILYGGMSWEDVEQAYGEEL
ncbi:MAG: hypothetical protein CMK59_12225 [Proteobacteria bacterium]|nr:hypothetical protein [Pseudomonadota bacterium]